MDARDVEGCHAFRVTARTVKARTNTGPKHRGLETRTTAALGIDMESPPAPRDQGVHPVTETLGS